MHTEQEKPQPQWLNVRQIGVKGWNSFDDAQDIQDNQVTDAVNVVYDRGYPTPRKGSSLKWAFPVGETNNLLCLFGARSSVGTNYPIAVYAPNFYFRDETNGQWIKLNSSYTPSSTYKALMYGYSNWNAGIGSDVLYAGNGTELSIKWQIAVGYLSVAAVGADTTLTLTDGTTFPASGTIVVKQSGNSEVYVSYTSKTGTNILNLSGTFGTTAAIGSCVTFQIASTSNVKKGKIFTNWHGRLIVGNQQGGECSVFGSESGNAENFTVGTNDGDPFAETITDGKGGISGLTDFGEYLLIEKEDSLQKLTTTTAQSGSTNVTFQQISVVPIVSDISMGPVQPWCTIKKNNLLIYATATEGVYAINPDITGYQTSVLMDIISKPIKPYTDTLDFTNSRITAFDQKVLLSASSTTSGDVVLVYDILRSDLQLLRSNRNPEEGNFVWSRFTGWNVKDWLIHNDLLFYGSRIDNNIYQCFTEEKIDNTNPYQASFTTKKWDFGMQSLPKTTAALYVAGTISPTESLFFDVILTTGDQDYTFTYTIDGDGKFVSTAIPPALAMVMQGVDIMGGGELDPATGSFKGYLSINSRYGFFTLQMRVYSDVNGTDWGVTGLGFAIFTEPKHPGKLNIPVNGDTSVVPNTVPAISPLG